MDLVIVIVFTRSCRSKEKNHVRMLPTTLGINKIAFREIETDRTVGRRNASFDLTNEHRDRIVNLLQSQ